MKDQVRCEEMAPLRIRGIGHPVAIHRVVDSYASLGDASGHVRAELPHLKLEADPERMSPDERRKAAALLEETASRLLAGRRETAAAPVGSIADRRRLPAGA